MTTRQNTALPRDGSKTGLRSVKSRTVAKSYMILFTILGLSCALMAYISVSQNRMLGYEKQLSDLKSSMKESSLHLKERIKREITTNVEKQQAHEIEKRDAAEEEFIPGKTYGSTYTRWGRRDCEGKAKKIYTGLAAGTHYSHTGGGSNYICLDFNVDYTTGKYIDGGQGSSHLYGVEFRDSAWIHNLFDVTDTEYSTLQYHSLPCTVCLADRKIDQVMIPGRETCPDGWTTEYKGYVMAGSHGDKHPSHFICVDERPQVVPGTSGNQQGAFLFMVETQCASLLCEPFVAGRELRCVVCSI